MQALLQLSAPWWHFVLRAVLVYVMVMVLMRISGKRAVGQFTPFDLVLLILIGNAVQNGINGGDNSLTGAALMAGTLIVINYLVALAAARNVRIQRLIEGAPVLLARDGQVFHAVLRRELVSEQDFTGSTAPGRGGEYQSGCVGSAGDQRSHQRGATAGVVRPARPASRAGAGSRPAAPRGCRLRAGSRIPSAPAAAGSSGSTRCGRRFAARTGCRDRRPG